jgi:NAD(P)H-nitrite reductase large subunit
MSDKTIICRCEDITLGEIRELLAQGFETMDEIKRMCRCGMGPCGGKTCSTMLIPEIAKFKKIHPKDVKLTTQRPPTKNIKLELLAKAGESHD